VQECIEAAALVLFEADEAKFHAAGREDVDVS
jgi:tRNA U54 and U55 pseudouridine synthase Pus10